MFLLNPTYSMFRVPPGNIKRIFLKFAEIKKRENLERVVGFIFSLSGFTKDAEAYRKEKGIACSEDEKWLETGKLK
jgi:hypothetical protein